MELLSYVTTVFSVFELVLYNILKALDSLLRKLQRFNTKFCALLCVIFLFEYSSRSLFYLGEDRHIVVMLYNWYKCGG